MTAMIFTILKGAAAAAVVVISVTLIVSGELNWCTALLGLGLIGGGVLGWRYAVRKRGDW